MAVRLQKFLASCGVAARRKGEKLITAGRVKVNGAVVTELGTKVDPAHDLIEVDNNPVRAVPLGVAIFYKPRKVVSTLSDPEGRPTVGEYLTKKFESYFPVGRLDFESEGLVVLTNDGELAEHLLHPRFEIDRTYRVEVEGRLSAGVAASLQNGVKLEDGIARGRATHVEDTPNKTIIDLTVREGRNRLVRRMMDAVGHPVLKLVRLTHGPFNLGTLSPGEIRAYTEEAYERVRLAVLRTNGEEERPRRHRGSPAKREIANRQRSNTRKKR